MKKVILLIVSIIAINFLPTSMFAQDIQIDDGAMFSLTTGTYLNTISSTTQTNSSTATVRIGVASPATVTLSGDHTAYYGFFTFTDGSTLNYASAGPLTVPAKVNLANNTTATTFVKKNAAFTLSGDQNDVTFRIGNYGVLDLSDAANSGDLTLAKNLYFTSNTDANSYIKYRLGTTTYKIISTAGKIYTNETDGVIDVSKKFVFDMTGVTAGTAGETRNFTIATCQTLPVVSGTPTASNAGDWTNFAVTVTGSGPFNIVFSATYLPPVINVIASAGTPSGSYSSLKDAFDMINMGIHNGVIQIEVFGTSTETATCVLNANGAGSAEYESVSLYPTATGLRIVGDLAEPLIDLDGADNVTIDGRVNRTGDVIDLGIANLSTSSTDGTSTVRFINDATSNTIKYCTLKGSSSANQGGIIYFSTTTADNGNDNNIIDKNDITCAADANRPINAIGSTGSSGKENSGNIISNSKIYNFLNRGMISYGINLSNYNTSWSITGNSFYETAPFVPTASVAYYAINIYPTTGSGFTVNNNYIGGNESLCGGTAWTKTNAFNNSFTAINLNVGTGTASSVQGNTIRNLDFANSLNASWYGINVTAGAVNIGTVTANTIGATSGNGSIMLTNSTNGGSFYGILLAGTGTTAAQNNTIGSVTAANTNSASAYHVYGIYKTGGGTASISNNTIGSTSTANSLYASSASTASIQVVYGILSDAIGTASCTFNTIANLKNGTTNTSNGSIFGISTTAGVNSISDNVIRDLSVASNTFYSVLGINQTSTDGGQSIIGNTVYNLSNTYATYTGHIYGIFFLGGNIGTNVVSKNFVHSLSLTATTTNNGICGISAEGGSATYANNIISLGGNTSTKIYGIYETGTADNNINVYFNTVCIGGVVLPSNTNHSYAFYSASNLNTRNVRNNIFYNVRTIDFGKAPEVTAGKHYAAYFAIPGLTLTCDYNDYYAPLPYGVLGFYANDKLALPIVTGQDEHSTNANPNMVSAGSATATDYKLIADLNGVSTGITTDYDDITRVNYTMGAWEYIPVAPTTQASLVAFTSVTYTSMTVGWTNGNGSRRAVFMKEGAGTITNPTDLTTYTASANWASKGTQLGTSGYYCIYNGNSNTVDLTGLNYGTTYYVQVFEYNGPALGEKYNTTTATDNPNSQATPAAYFSDGTNYYGTWSGVASGISSGGTATLLADYTQPSGGVTILTDFTLDLNGHSFGGAQTSTIADSKSLGLKGSTGSFDGVISFAGTSSSLRILSDLTFGTNFITAGSNGGVIIGDGTSSLAFACDNGDALFTHVASLRVKSSAVLALGEGATYTPEIIVEDGGFVKLISDASTYPNTFTTTTSNSASTAILQIGNSTAISTTLTGNMADFYGRVTMVDGSQLVVNMAVSGKGQVATNAARFEVGGSSNVSATSLSFVAGLTLNNGDITGATNSITIDKYGVLNLMGLTGAMNITYGNVVINNPTDSNHGYIQFGIAYTTTLAGGSFDIGTSIDVSSHFTFDMNNHIGTYGQTESFTFAITHSTLPSLTGTPAPINSNHWSDFSVTKTAPPVLTPTGWLLKLNALYYTPILYVDASKTDDNGDGLSWENAKKTLQAALDLSVSGYQIWVKEGTYYPTLERGGSGERFKTFQMKDGVAIYGSFDLTTPEATIADRAIKDNPTILSGDLDQNDTYSGTGSSLTISNNSGNCYSVVRNDVGVAAVGPTAILDGFVIKGGNADHNSTALLYGGGGMHNNSTNPTIRNCRFEYNSAKYGGAFFSWNSTSAFYNCVFVNNYGYASGSGGAIYNNNGNGLVFNNCDIVNNYSATNGGGISTNNSPANNTSTILNNSIVWGNYSVNSGHQIYCTSGGNITLNYSCYQNEANDVNSGGGTFTNTNFDITTDPKFVDAPNGDFSIAGTSSCLDLGNDTYSTLTTDIRGAGFGRKLLKTDPLTVGTIDIGAYEYKFGTDPATLCTDPSTAGEIAADQTICAGEIPNDLTSISEPTGYTGTLEYQWQSNTTSSTFTFDNIIGANSSTFTPEALTTTTWFKRLARVSCMADWSGAVSSNVIMITVEQPQLYVTVTGAGSKNGLSWDNAFDQTQLQAAINQSCGEIWVAKGTYYPIDATYKFADRYIAFHMKEGVEIYGGFVGTEGSGYDKSLRNFVTNETILSGDIGTPVVNTDNSYHVFYHPSGLGLTSATLIDGFTISGGNADGSDPFNCGAAMYNNNNSPSISNCVFTGNAASGNGGAIYNTTNVIQSITNSSFDTNTAKNGGAIFNIDNSDVALISCVIHANQATENGGGAFWMHDACDITLTNCLLYENTSPTWGGGFIILPGANAHVINSTLSQNASGYGGGIYNSGGTLVIDNSILWGNTSSQWGNQIETTNGISTILNNSCFANVYGPTTWDVEGTVTNNASITTNPGFINPLIDDFRVQGNSPCINTGNNTYNSETTDIRGQLRIQQTTIDMGAYEWTTGVDPANGDVFVKFNATGSNNGTSWTDAFTSLQSALNLPLLEGDIIWVAKGTYYPSSAYNLTNESRFYHFRMLPGVAMYGSLLGNEDVETYNLNLRDLYTNTTTLSGNIGIEADSTDNAYHVFYHPDGLGLNTLAILDGFKVSEAVANGGGDFNNGGAMFNDNNSPLIRNCNFYKNASADWGGAIYNTNSDPEFNRVSFTHNKATTDGGAVFNNNASSPVFDNCAFSRNSVTYSGGAVYSKESSTPILTNCVIAYNSAMYGGGVFSQSPTQLINCTVSENEAYQGGGLSNEADVTLKNTILWGNRAVDGKQMFVKALTTTDMQYCDYANETGDISGSVTATNSITTFPKFVDKATGDFRIFDNSPSADAGFDAFNALTTDVRGTGFARKLNKVNASEVGTIDMGAYEYNFGIDPVCTMPTTAGSIGSAQTICYNTAPGTLTNTLSPTGNIGPLEYKWQLSTTSATEGYTDIASSDSESLVCGTLTVSTWYKRLVRVNCAEDWTNALATDPVKITVYNDFSAGEIETTGETICYNFDPVEIGSTTASSGGDEDITYQWQSSTDEAFTTPSDINTDAVSYDPPSGLTVTTWYRRQAKDATCNTSWTSSTGVWKVTVDPASVGGTITGTITITYGESTGNLVLGGNVGDVLKWQHKVGTELWEDISNTSLTHSESPVSAGTWTYRAEVQSGVCSSTWSDEFVVTVDKKALTTTGATADDKVYDGNTDATISGASLVGIENSDDVSLDDLTGTFASEAFGTHSVTATLTLKGTEKDNYTLTQPTGLSADITAKELTVSGASADNKIYDGNTDAEISGASLVGIVGLDDVDLDALTGTFESEIVGTHTVTATLTLKGTDKDNYSLTQPTGLSADITAKELTVSSATADDKVYDGNTDAEISGASLVGIVGLDDVDLDALTGAFESEIVGTHTVTATLTLKGTDKDNYSLTQPTGLSADITAKELTVSGASANDKVYDGNTDATISGASLVGIVGTDDVELDDLTGVFESYLVGTHSVTATLTLMGTDKDNYSLTQPTGLTAEIYPGVPDHFTITSPGTATAGAASGNFVIALFDAFNNPTTSDVNATFNLSTNSTSGSNTFNPASPLVMLADTYTSTFTYTENRLGTFAITAVGATGPTGLIGESRSANITIQILPWQKASIGVSSGNTDFFPTINAGTFKQTAQGLSAPKNDVMNFEYQQLCGNGTVIARLADVVNGGWAGVMMRESNAVGSKTVLFKTKLYNPMANVGVRSTTNGNISNTTQNLPNIHWMKIQRTNANTFVVYTSYNGTTWIRRFTATVAMNNCINAGIFTENAVSGRTTTAWIDHAEVVGYLKDSDDENVVFNTEDAFEVMIYPNPATDKVMITIPENEEKVKVTLINASGLVVETSEFNTMDVEYYINHIKPGMYLLRFERNGMIVNKRLVVL